MIGLIDYDLQTSTSVNLHPPNLEIMKLATYYKLEQQHFCRLMSLNETELTAYDKIYFFSEAETRPEVPEAFLKSNNVIYGGMLQRSASLNSSTKLRPSTFQPAMRGASQRISLRP